MGRMLRRLSLRLAAGTPILLLGLGLGLSHAQIRETPELLSRGESLFKSECAVCHGNNGKGDGTAAYLLFPKPRDLTMGVFKIRSTPTGEPPTDEDLLQTITQGLPGSAMPSFRSLAEEDRWSLVYHVKKLADITEPPERVIEVPQEPSFTSSMLKDGQALYSRMKCWECHGTAGKGDGPSALTAKDDLRYPAPPNDFTRGIYKGGGRNSDIYLRFTTGMDGTPMPSYEASMKEKERWALVYYVKSLAGLKVAVQPGGGDIAAKKISGKIRMDPLDPIWDGIAVVEIPLMLLWQRQTSVEAVSVKAVHNGKEIAMLLEWDDPSPQAHFTRHQDYSDSAAIQFPISDKERSVFTMGEKARPVNIWHWRADRQLDMHRFQDIEDAYPAMAWDVYPFAKGFHPRDMEKPLIQPVGAVSTHDPVYITGWGAGNPVSNPRRVSAVEELNAEGFGTATTQSPDEQNVIGRGVWAYGKWKVLFVRSLASGGRFDPQFDPGRELPVAFAIWDGSQAHRDGQKSVTPWYNLKLEK